MKILEGKTYRELTTEEIEKRKADAEAYERKYWANADYGEEVDKKIREKYSVSQEFSILRQKDEKPEEYKAYFDYCEECKAFVKEKKGG